MKTKTKSGTQVERLYEHLRHSSITRLDALNVLGIFELSARVGELEKKYDVRVQRENIKVTNRFNETATVTKYYAMLSPGELI